MASYFDKEFFVGNRARLRQLFAGTAPIVITANGLLQSSSEVALPFRQDSNFWYLCGINEPDLILVLDKDREYIILPERQPSRDMVEGSLNTKQFKAISGINSILDNKSGWKLLSARLKKAKHLANIPPPDPFVTHFGFYTNPARRVLNEKIKEINPDIKFLDLKMHFAKMRSVKQPAELLALQQAINITSSSLKQIKQNLAKFSTEDDIKRELAQLFSKYGSDELTWPPVIASGKNACAIHYSSGSSKLSPKELVLIDVGAEVENYAADITRVYSLSKPTKRQQQVYAAVKEIQDFASGLLKPAVIWKDYEKLVDDFTGEKLREMGLVKSITQKSVKAYYPHYASHFLGLDVHDWGNYQESLAENMVLTIEPGIYIPKEGIGVRLEDDFLITKNGAKNLSRAAPYL